MKTLCFEFTHERIERKVESKKIENYITNPVARYFSLRTWLSIESRKSIESETGKLESYLRVFVQNIVPQFTCGLFRPLVRL